MGEANLGRLGQLIPLLVRRSFFFVVVTCSLCAILSFNVVTSSAMFVFLVLCCHLVDVNFRSKWYCFSSRVKYFVGSVI